eukprot:3919582-Alexandrium_andersonii.AAC.1
MSASLVGSEMCIRDSQRHRRVECGQGASPALQGHWRTSVAGCRRAWRCLRSQCAGARNCACHSRQ